MNVFIFYVYLILSMFDIVCYSNNDGKYFLKNEIKIHICCDAKNIFNCLEDNIFYLIIIFMRERFFLNIMHFYMENYLGDF